MLEITEEVSSGRELHSSPSLELNSRAPGVLLHGIFVDLLTPFLRSFDRSELIGLHVALPHGGYPLTVGTFWNRFEPISVEVHYCHVMLWAGRATVGLFLTLCCDFQLVFAYLRPLLLVEDEKKYKEKPEES